MRTDFQNMLVEQDESVVTLTMNRPDVLNATNTLMLEELTEAVEAAADDETIRCVVLTGAGRAFGAGQDLTEFGSTHAGNQPLKVSEHLAKYHRLILGICHMPKPVIAAIQGVATGISLNIALACDIRIAADNARLLEAFARIGLVPDGGGGYTLPRLIGLGRALEMATYRLIKELMYKSLDIDLQASLRLEGQLQEAAYATADHREAVDAFLHKRAVKFTGK